jgi:hypothetical protein
MDKRIYAKIEFVRNWPISDVSGKNEAGSEEVLHAIFADARSARARFGPIAGRAPTAHLSIVQCWRSATTIHPYSALYVRERLRAAAPMNGGIKGLGDDDLQSVSAAIAKLPLPGPCSQKISHCGGKCAVAFEL